MQTFQFAYLNESSIIIRLYGLKSSDHIVTATAKIYAPGGYVNNETGNFEYNLANKTMLLQKVKEKPESLSHSTITNERAHEDYRSNVVTQRTNYWENYDYNLRYGNSSSFVPKASIILLVCVLILNFKVFN